MDFSTVENCTLDYTNAGLGVKAHFDAVIEKILEYLGGTPQILLYLQKIHRIYSTCVWRISYDAALTLKQLGISKTPRVNKCIAKAAIKLCMITMGDWMRTLRRVHHGSKMFDKSFVNVGKKFSQEVEEASRILAALFTSELCQIDAAGFKHIIVSNSLQFTNFVKIKKIGNQAMQNRLGKIAFLRALVPHIIIELYELGAPLENVKDVFALMLPRGGLIPVRVKAVSKCVAFQDYFQRLTTYQLDVVIVNQEAI